MHQIAWFWTPKLKNLPTVGGGTPPSDPTPSPRLGRFAPSPSLYNYFQCFSLTLIFMPACGILSFLLEGVCFINIEQLSKPVISFVFWTLYQILDITQLFTWLRTCNVCLICFYGNRVSPSWSSPTSWTSHTWRAARERSLNSSAPYPPPRPGARWRNGSWSWRDTWSRVSTRYVAPAWYYITWLCNIRHI